MIAASKRCQKSMEALAGRTVAHHAIYSSQTTIVDFLVSDLEVDFDQKYASDAVDNFDSFTSRDNDGVTPAHIASANGFTEVVRYLGEESVVNRCDNFGNFFGLLSNCAH